MSLQKKITLNSSSKRITSCCLAFAAVSLGGFVINPLSAHAYSYTVYGPGNTSATCFTSPGSSIVNCY